MFKKKPIGSFIEKLKEKKYNHKKDDDMGTVRVKVSNQFESEIGPDEARDENRLVSDMLEKLKSLVKSYARVFNKEGNPLNSGANQQWTKPSLFNRMPFHHQHRVRDHFWAKKITKKFSRSVTSLNQNDDLMANKIAKSRSLNDDGLLPGSSSPPVPPPRHQHHYRVQNNNLYRRLKGAPRTNVLNQFAAYQHTDNKQKTNKHGVIERITRWSPFPKEEHQTPRRVYESEDAERYHQNFNYEDDDDDDSIFVDESSESEREVELSNERSPDDVELERQIWHEIYLLDKTLEQYS